jgi:hypothetical protein
LIDSVASRSSRRPIGGEIPPARPTATSILPSLGREGLSRLRGLREPVARYIVFEQYQKTGGTIAYPRPDAVEVHADPDHPGYFELFTTRRGVIWQRAVGPDDYVSVLEAASMVSPSVVTNAVYYWIEHGLAAANVAGLTVIQVSELRRFAESYGYELVS